ncbi:dihydropteridine reductase [Brachionus plicatilis]|uniref:Dihydropteridine reductase n=1 Tax=Brachionus plicatilis TaxID=10195 RepID=A0A3M7REB1_BRAPC|nr:dihydropteridine reductase [Brachionus plicatilis]
MSNPLKKILVYGGNGALGKQLVDHLKTKNYWVVCVDLKENDEANANIIVDPTLSMIDQEKKIDENLKPFLSNDGKLDAILNVAGGWAGGNSASNQFLSNSDLMWKQSVWSSLISASLAAKYLNENGVLTLPGAAAALDSASTPGMIGYGMAKAAIHQLTKSLADSKGGLPANTLVAAILPVTLDTPMNRKWMSKADFSTWTPLSYIAELFEKWIQNPNDRPLNGSLVKLTTTNNVTQLSFH